VFDFRKIRGFFSSRRRKWLWGPWNIGGPLPHVELARSESEDSSPSTAEFRKAWSYTFASTHLSASHYSPPGPLTYELALGKKGRKIGLLENWDRPLHSCAGPIPRPRSPTGCLQHSVSEVTLSGKGQVQAEEEKCNTSVLILCVWRTGSNSPQNCRVTRSTQPWVDKGAATQARQGLSLIYESLRKRCAAARRALPAAAWGARGYRPPEFTSHILYWDDGLVIWRHVGR
jgi:hypothetical protein